MMEWSVVKVDARPQLDSMQNVIYAVLWKVKEGSKEWTSWTFLDTPPADSFIPFEQLTEAQVLQWVFDTMRPEQKAQHEANVSEMAIAPEEPKMVTLTLP